MMQLVCNGVALDLPEGTGLQFTQENPLFAFDNLKCERTTQFKLPATATNDRVLSVARVPAYSGEGMRRKFAAQLQAGAIVKNGLLYVTAWNGEEYEAVFVTGELIGLQAIKDAGKIKDFFSTSGTAVYGDTPLNAWEERNSFFCVKDYKTDDAGHIPTFSVNALVNGIAGQKSWRVTMPSAGIVLQYTPEKPMLPESVDVLFKNNITGIWHSTQAEAAILNTPSMGILQNRLFSLSSDAVILYRYDELSGSPRNDYYAKLRGFKPLAGLKITFPEDWNDDYYIVRLQDGVIVDSPSSLTFLGGRSFTRPRNGAIQASGESLRGRSVDLERGQAYLIIDANWYVYTYTQIGSDTYREVQGFNPVYMETNVNISGGEAQIGDTIRAQDNLPDFTFVELLKSIAAASGLVLYYTEEDGVLFDDLNFENWEINNITEKIIKTEKVEKIFSDYNKHNIILFDSGNSIQQFQRVTQDYTIDNDNLEEEKELLKIPMSEGGVVYDGYEATFINKETGKPVLSKVVTDGQFLARLSLPKNANLQDLCDASTQIIVTAWMTAEEYDAINAKTLILCDGTLYVWTARQWQKDVAKFTLARIK